MKTFRLYTGKDGQSHIEPIDLSCTPSWTRGLATTQISFRETPAGNFLDWHPAPRRQFVIILSGQLEIRLAERGQPARVHDLAVVDYGTAQELLWLRERAAGLAYDTLVVALYPGNDFANNTPALAGRTGVSPGDALRPYLVPRAGGGFDLKTVPLP